MVDSKLNQSPVFLLRFNVFLCVETVWMHRIANKQRKHCSFLSFSVSEPTLCLFFICSSSSSLLSPCPGSSNVRPSCPGIRVCLKIAKLACYFPGSSALTLYPPPPPFLSSHLSPDPSLQQRDSRETLCLQTASFTFGGNTNPRQVRETLKTLLRIERRRWRLCFQSRILASSSFLSLFSLCFVKLTVEYCATFPLPVFSNNNLHLCPVCELHRLYFSCLLHLHQRVRAKTRLEISPL